MKKYKGDNYNMNATINIKTESGIFPKIIKTACLITFPVITTVCVTPFYINNLYKVVKSYNNCQQARKNIVGKELGLIQYIQQRGSNNGNI